MQGLADGTAPADALRAHAASERAAAVGLTEAVNLAFVSPKQLEKARVSTDARARRQSALRRALGDAHEPAARAARQRAARAASPGAERAHLRAGAHLHAHRRRAARGALQARLSCCRARAPAGSARASRSTSTTPRGCSRRCVPAAHARHDRDRRRRQRCAAEHPYLHPRRAARVRAVRRRQSACSASCTRTCSTISS